MTGNDLVALLPFLILAAAPVVVMLGVAVRRHHGLAFGLTVASLGLSLAALSWASGQIPRQVTPLLILDPYAFFYTALVVVAGLAVALLAYGHLNRRPDIREEFYILLLLAILGAAILTASNHFASFFIGLELLSVSLYPMIAYERGQTLSSEAGIKYLILAAASASFLVFGMALVYAELGTLNFPAIVFILTRPAVPGPFLITGLAMILVGVGFKLGVAPFHMWAPDVFEGASAPVGAFIASVSKGGMFALLLRNFAEMNPSQHQALFVIFSVLAVASMFTGNLLALRQRNVKRILAYSSVAHMGYLLVAFLASGPLRLTAVTFYIAAYFVTTLGAFGVVSVLSDHERDADRIEDYRGLFWRNPGLAAIFTAMLLSLAGIPLTAGFIGKFYLITAGIGSALWFLVLMLLLNSTLSLVYYLRLVSAMYAQPDTPPAEAAAPAWNMTGAVVLAAASGALLWLGVYPSPLVRIIQALTLTGH